MQAFREGLRQPICERLQHDPSIVVGLVDMLRHRFGFTNAGGNRKSADVIREASTCGGDEVGERRVGAFAASFASHLLPQRM